MADKVILGKDGRPLIKYVVQPNKVVGTAGSPLTEGQFIMSDQLYWDENKDKAADLVAKGVIAIAPSDAAPAPAPIPDSKRVADAKAEAATARTEAEAAIAAQAAAEADAKEKADQLAAAMSLLTPDQLAQIAKQANGGDQG